MHVIRSRSFASLCLQLRDGCNSMLPAHGLYHALRKIGWDLREGWVSSEHLATCDAWRREVVLPPDFRQRLMCPDLEREVRHWVIAHELGHAVLHADQLLQGERGDWMEREASEFALCFLLPEDQLAAHPDIQGLAASAHDARWRRLSRVAQEFKVPIQCLLCALDLYALRPLDLAA